MKIAIIEDRILRLEQYVEFDIRSSQYVDIITGHDFDNLIISLEKKDQGILDQYACIASHRSALSNIVRDIIKDHCKIREKPLIFFSGGITSSVFKDLNFPFLHINSKEFYSLNLQLFISNYAETRSINLLILQFGKRWKLSLLLNLRNSIAVAQNKQLIKNNIGIAFDEKEFIRRVRDLQINSLIRPYLINERTETILSGNEFASITNDQIQEIQSVINQLINEMA